MARIPGTGGPTDVPYRPEGGIEDGPFSQTVKGPLPGGSNRFPQPAPANVEPQQGAGVPGVGGLTPNPGEPTSGTVQRGFRGDSYASQGPSDEDNEFVTGGRNGSSNSVLGVPTSFTDL